MTKGECLQIVSACGADDMSDTLLELAVAMKLEEGHTKDEVLEMTALVLEDSEGLEETG